jgi:tetratricopeptide (TPR) repeat protein
MNEGVGLARRGDVDGALAALRRASALDPSLAHAWLNLGHLERKRGRMDDAAAAFRSGLAGSGLADDNGPLGVELRAQLGGVLLLQATEAGVSQAERTAKASEAVELLQAATAAEPQRVRSLRRLAQAHEHLDQPSQADVAYRRAIAADPTYSPAYVGLAELYVAYGFPELAILVLHEDIARNPEQVDGRVALGRALASSGRHQDAVETFQKAIAFDPDQLQARFGLGMAHAELGQRAQAIEALQRFLQHAGPDTPAATVKLANDTVARLQDTL